MPKFCFLYFKSRLWLTMFFDILIHRDRTCTTKKNSTEVYLLFFSYIYNRFVKINYASIDLKNFFLQDSIFCCNNFILYKKNSHCIFLKKKGKEQQSMGVRDRDAAARNCF